MTEPNCLLIGGVARRLGCTPRQVRKVFERGLLPPAKRLGPNRVIAEADLPAVEAALRQAGYLSAEAAASVGRE